MGGRRQARTETKLWGAKADNVFELGGQLEAKNRRFVSRDSNIVPDRSLTIFE